ncbi:MAG: hypothetical protein L6Q35_16075 [Phycisphaerales bacterium]|nr:hypothetical protein [Phycisphaerales bacterium]
MPINHRHALSLIATSASLSTTAVADIVYTDLNPDMVLFTSLAGEQFLIAEFDINTDGVIDLSIQVQSGEGDASTAAVVMLNGAEGIHDTPGASMHPFNAGELIADPLDDTRFWTTSGSLDWKTVDTWPDDGAYLGFRMPVAGGFQYGWMSVACTIPDIDSATVTVFGFAYETDVDTGIAAGMVPAPGSLCVLALGALVCPRTRRG